MCKGGVEVGKGEANVGKSVRVVGINLFLRLRLVFSIFNFSF